MTDRTPSVVVQVFSASVGLLSIFLPVLIGVVAAYDELTLLSWMKPKANLILFSLFFMVLSSVIISLLALWSLKVRASKSDLLFYMFTGQLSLVAIGCACAVLLTFFG